MNIKEQVIQARLLRGYTYGQIKSEFGIAKSTARGWVDTYERQAHGEPWESQTHVNDNLERNSVQTRMLSKAESVEEFLEKLAPIDVGPVTRNISSDLNSYVVVMGDMHFPKHCQKSIDVALATIEQLKPYQIVLNGDTVDLLAVSRYPKDIRHSYTLLDERVAYQKFLRDLIEVSGGAKIIETHANHSGNGTDGRWFRYLSERLGELASLDDICEKLSYQNIFLGDLQDYVEHCDYVQIAPDLMAIHGDVVRKNGGYSARGMLDKYYHSLIMGHTHRLGMTAQRIPGIGGREDKQVVAWEMGCLCDLNPLYASAPNWQNGFGIVAVSGDGDYSVEPVMIQNGVACVSTLGCTIKAS